MAASRHRAWLRDELILALDLYLRDGVGASAQSITALSKTLRAFPIEPELAASLTFRSPASVRRKLANFLAIDPEGAGGLSHGGRGDRDVWDQFAHDRPRLREVADAIREMLGGLKAEPEISDEPSLTEAPEGRLLTRIHLARERSGKLVEAKKKSALAQSGKLACESCGFDFAETYGERGDGFIECHHLRPVASLRPGQVTRLSDLALVCSNCHRIVHRRAPWLTLEELKALTQEAAEIPTS
jgi:5-methylcytosine-specific restriction protein A